MSYFDRCMQQLSLDLFENIGDKIIIYLDLKYWILLRDRDRITDITKSKVAEHLIRLLDNNKCVFPISKTTFWEIMKQTEDTRELTFAVVDKFSKGLTIANGNVRLRIEFYYWMQKLQKRELLIEPAKLIWTHINLEIGRKFYSDKASLLDETIQKSLINFVCGFSISDLFNSNNQPFPSVKYKDNIEAFNENKEKHKNENKSFDEMFLSELGGMLDVFKNDINDIVADSLTEQTGRQLTEDEKQHVDKDAWCKLIYQSFRLKKVTTELSLLKIYPTLHAVMRWNKDRKYKDGNDTMDVMHAATALPYCNYFFTEKELATMVIQQKLDKAFSCIVESDPRRVLTILESM